MKREVFVCAAEPRYEVVFERANSTFSCVAAVHMGGNELEVHVFGAEKSFEDGRAFIVESL